MHHFLALVGAPNSGKTTLYNWLTGSKFKTVNYPGATVEYSVGNLANQWNPPHPEIKVMDTPGTYSLFPKSGDEEVTLNALYQHPTLGPVGKVILVVDGTQLSRHLLLAEQLREAGFNFVIALTMADLLKKKDVEINISLLQKAYQCEVVLIDGLLGGGIVELVKKVLNLKDSSPVKLRPWSDDNLASRQKKIELLVEQALQKDSLQRLGSIYDQTAKVDRFLLHPVFGLLLFFIVMVGLFSSIFWLATPFMDLIDEKFAQLNNFIQSLAPGTLLTDFLGNGIIGSFAAILVFVPQIFILFFGIGIMENSGYLARAATLIDKPFSKIGLSGRSFVPILSGFACAVPAMMASRNISSKRDRLITNFIIPLLTCSARLPVYALLVTFVFKGESSFKAGLTLASLYLGSLVLGSVAAGILNRILAKTEGSFFMMELPMYRKPQWRSLLRGTISRTSSYVKKAGPVIFIFAVLIWAGTTFPNYKLEDPHEKLQQSYLGQAGQVFEPVFKPMGVDWRVGVGLMSAFAAREVFVSSLAVMFNITAEDEETQSKGLLVAMSQAQFADGTAIFTLASVLGLILFFMIALQCMSTFAIAVKEQGSRFAWTQLIVFNVVAYILSVALVQGLRFIGVA